MSAAGIAQMWDITMKIRVAMVTEMAKARCFFCGMIFYADSDVCLIFTGTGLSVCCVSCRRSQMNAGKIEEVNLCV